MELIERAQRMVNKAGGSMPSGDSRHALPQEKIKDVDSKHGISEGLRLASLLFALIPLPREVTGFFARSVSSQVCCLLSAFKSLLLFLAVSVCEPTLLLLRQSSCVPVEDGRFVKPLLAVARPASTHALSASFPASPSSSSYDHSATGEYGSLDSTCLPACSRGLKKLGLAMVATGLLLPPSVALALGVRRLRGALIVELLRVSCAEWHCASDVDFPWLAALVCNRLTKAFILHAVVLAFVALFVLQLRLLAQDRRGLAKHLPVLRSMAFVPLADGAMTKVSVVACLSPSSALG